MRNIFKNLLHFCFPEQCILCDIQINPAQVFCAVCYEVMPHYIQGCQQCAFFLKENDNQTRCGKCLSNPPSFDHVMALFEYQPPISSLIWRLKFSGNLRVAHLFSKLWINYLIKNKLTLPEAIIPVPLHFNRLKQRGFNQALEIAKPIGKYFQIPIDTRTCIRIKNTEAQSSLYANKRKNNVKNAFALSYTPKIRHVAIIDDVMTTGNTVAEISALLKKAGVKKIDVWCCARANHQL